MDYYRGSGTYEVAVRNQLNALEATGDAAIRAIGSMETGLRSDIRANTSELQGLRSDIRATAVGMYNMGQEIGSAIYANTNAIQDMAMGVAGAIQQSTYAVVASQTMLANTFRQGFDSVNNMLDLGFGLVGNKIDVLSDNICSKLDQIHDILNNPRLTQSRELYRQALASYQKGLFEEALEDCKEAVEKNKTDSVSWYLLGLIYLFGAGKFSNVIDLDKAEEAFFNAAKYIDADIGKSQEAKVFASEIYHYLGVTRLVKSNDSLIENRIDDSNQKLAEAEKASRTAYQLSKDNLPAGYERAKELHFLERDDEALKLLEELIRKEKNFALKALNDKNFESIQGRIEDLILRLRDEVAEGIIRQCNDFRALYDTGRRQRKLSAVDIPSETQVDEFEDFCRAELNKNELRRSVCDDFNELAGDENEDVFHCTNVIVSVRTGRNALQGKLDKVSALVAEALNPFESLLCEDYFFVLQKAAEFKGKENQDKLNYVSSEIVRIFRDFDSGLKALDKNARNMHSYLDAKKEWDARKLRLRDQRAAEVEKECGLIRGSWVNRIEELRGKLADRYFPKNATESVRNEREYLSKELDVVSSRIGEALEQFESLQKEDYFVVLRKYEKFRTDYLVKPESYFEYSLSELDSGIRNLVSGNF